MLFALGSAARAEQWALLVGVDQYEDANHISPLSTADADAAALAKTLRDVRGVPSANIEVLTSSGPRKPTRANIIEALSRLADNLKPGDTAFVFFSGHGTQIAGKTYLLPYDFRGRNAFAGLETALATEKISGLLQQASSATVVLGWDMCRNDPFAKTRGGNERNKMPAPSEKSWRSVAGEPSGLRVVEIFACSPGQCSFEWRDQKRGYFSYFLEQGLRGAAADSKGQITAQGLADFVVKSVSASVRRDENEGQDPYPVFFGSGTPSVVLANAGRKASPPVVLDLPETAPKPGNLPPRTPQPGEWMPGNPLWDIKYGKWEERTGAYVFESQRIGHSFSNDVARRAEYLDTSVKPKSGNKLIVIPWEVKNITKRPQVYWWFYDTSVPTCLYTDEETAESPYYPAGLFDINQETDLPRSAEIPPGGTLKFHVVFAIPQKEAPEKLHFMLNGSGGDTRITINLKK